MVLALIFKHTGTQRSPLEHDIYTATIKNYIETKVSFYAPKMLVIHSALLKMDSPGCQRQNPPQISDLAS